jgi:hypothetical protein
LISMITVGSVGSAQMLMEQNAAMGGMDALSGQNVAGGQVAMDRARAVAAPNPGLPGLGGGRVGEEVELGFEGGPVPGQPGGVPTPTPIPTIQVLDGRRVFDAVTGALIEDAVKTTVPITEQDRYFDDGVRDNGIPNDGIKGRVETIRDRVIGAETAAGMFKAINLVRNAESMSVLQFFRLRAGETDPSLSSGRLPDLIELERQKDDFLRDWNNRFLAVYRVDRNNPRSDFFQTYVPEPPAIPQFPLPPGYQSPQRTALGIGATQGGAQQQQFIGGEPMGPITPTPNIMNGESHFGDWTQARPLEDGK